MPPLVTRSFDNSTSSLKVSNTLRQNFRHRTIITNKTGTKRAFTKKLVKESQKNEGCSAFTLSHIRGFFSIVPRKRPEQQGVLQKPVWNR
jgi:hypothetical protein